MNSVSNAHGFSQLIKCGIFYVDAILFGRKYLATNGKQAVIVLVIRFIKKKICKDCLPCLTTMPNT